MSQKPNLYLIDLFCGAGGVTTGFDAARFNNKQFCEVIACINHDAKAIDSHYMNHPFVTHYTEDVRQLDLSELVRKVNKIRASDPNAYFVLWASLECTNFSKAKGGKSRKADSRMLADEMDRYILALNPDYFMVENVIEFTDWGPLRIAATEHETYSELHFEGDEYLWVPDKTRLKEFFNRWKNRIKSYDYRFEDNNEGTLNAADYGACQSRKRYFAVFAKPSLPIAFPTQTHCKNPQKNPGLKKWVPVRKVLDLNNHGPSIFIKNRIKSEKSWSRVYEGLIKHVAGGKKKFMIKYNSVNGKTGKHVVPGINEPSPTLNTHGRLGVVTPEFLVHQQNSSTANSVSNPSPTILTNNKLSVATCQFINKNFSGNPEHKNQSIDKSIGTVTTIDHHALVTTHYLVNYHGKSKDDKSIDVASGTVTTKEDCGLITCIPFVMDTQFGNGTKSVDEPIGTIVANRKWHYIVNPQWGNKNTNSVDVPSHTIIARMDKTPPYLITTEEGFLAIEIFESDSEMMRKVKEFMALYGIVDIKMRMLTIIELLRIQWFPAKYILVGTQADQKKFIGNAVEVNQAKVIAEALYAALFNHHQMRVAA